VRPPKHIFNIALERQGAFPVESARRESKSSNVGRSVP
jgi:hypothetical protein